MILSNRARLGRLVLEIMWYVVVLFGAVVILFPFVWGMISSFRPVPAIFRYLSPLSWQTLSPTPFSFEAYLAVFEKGFGRALLNTFFVTVATVGLGLVVNSMGGLAFAKMQFPGKEAVFLFTLVAFMVPFQAIAIPLFTLIRGLGWTNSYQALIVPALFNGVVILLFRQFFIGIPDDYVDSAKMDGAKWGTIYWRLFLPMSGPAVVSAALILFLDIWLAFLWPLIVNPNKDFEIVQVSIARLSTQYNIVWNEIFAAVTITAIVPVVILITFQKQYFRALTGSEIKG